jgi:hypothetical protein
MVPLWFGLIRFRRGGFGADWRQYNRSAAFFQAKKTSPDPALTRKNSITTLWYEMQPPKLGRTGDTKLFQHEVHGDHWEMSFEIKLLARRVLGSPW